MNKNGKITNQSFLKVTLSLFDLNKLDFNETHSMNSVIVKIEALEKMTEKKKKKKTKFKVSDRRMPVQTFIELIKDEVLFEEKKVSLGLKSIELDEEYYLTKLIDQYKKLSWNSFI